MTTALTILAILLVLLSLPARAEAHVQAAPLTAGFRVCWPFALVGVGWELSAGPLLWLGPRTFRIRSKPRRKPRAPKPRTKPRARRGGRLDRGLHLAGETPALWRLARRAVLALRPTFEQDIELTWDDPYLIAQAEGLRYAFEGATGVSAPLPTLRIGQPALEGGARLRLTLSLPWIVFTAVRLLLSADGRAVLAAMRRPRATRGETWKTSSNSSGASRCV